VLALPESRTLRSGRPTAEGLVVSRSLSEGVASLSKQVKNREKVRARGDSLSLGLAEQTD
jgi:hypothetical protein